jgi:hypothetical protein
VTALDRGISVAADLGQRRLAAFLGGAATKGPLAPLTLVARDERETREEILDHTRSALGADTYNAESARGATMTYTNIVPYLLGELDRLLAESRDER